jgi:hypothetical protein
MFGSGPDMSKLAPRDTLLEAGKITGAATQIQSNGRAVSRDFHDIEQEDSNNVVPALQSFH